jgi:hypothetical protein
MSFGRHKFSTISFAIAVAIYSTAYFFYQRHDWSPLEISVHALGEDASGRFVAQLDAEHDVLVEFDQAADPEYWACVYGAKVFSGNCSGEVPVARVYWKVTESERVISSGVATDTDRWAGSGDTIMRSKITSINAEEGLEYAISVSLSGPQNMLEETRPRVVVELHPSLHKDAFVKASLLSMLGHVFFIGAVAAFSIERFFKWRSDRQRK